MLSLSHCSLMRSHGRALVGCLLLTCFATPNIVAAAPIDEFRLSDIEQKIRDLETTTRDQARLIAQLQSQLAGNRSATRPTTTEPLPNRSEQRWLSAGNWAQLKPGMSELQVIELLGIPTQIRVSDDGQTRSLLYAMEIGRSGFLSGKVDLQNRQTSNIELPHLK